MSIIQQRRQWLSPLALAFLRISFQSIEKVEARYTGRDTRCSNTF